MLPSRQHAQPTSIRRLAVAALVVLLISAVGSNEAPAAGATQKHFASPEEAVMALVEALKTGDTKALTAILGPEARPLITSGDTVADTQGRQRLVAEYEQAHKLEKAGDAKAILSIGKDDWPLPIPVVKAGDAWRFDTAAGQEEILNRRIGRNELSTIQFCLAYVDAQREYARLGRDGASGPEYAQKFLSDKGRRNGLYWKTLQVGEVPSPLGPLVANARAEGYGGKRVGGKPTPYHGYLFRILTAQGPDAPGGAYDYVVNGRMIGGFALVAYPAQYGGSGVMTFIVNHEGVVHQMDLGEDTAKVAQAMKTYNPDSTWKKVQ
jgi:Protein of unknown function (DUF2950)